MKTLFSKFCPAGIALSLPLLLAPGTPMLCQPCQYLMLTWPGVRVTSGHKALVFP